MKNQMNYSGEKYWYRESQSIIKSIVNMHAIQKWNYCDNRCINGRTSRKCLLCQLLWYFIAIFTLLWRTPSGVLQPPWYINNNNNNYDNLYGALTRPYRYKGASQTSN